METVKGQEESNTGAVTKTEGEAVEAPTGGRRMMTVKALIKTGGEKVAVIKTLHWLVLPGKQRSNMCDSGKEISAT